MIKLVLLLSIMLNFSIARCDDVLPLKKGDITPKDGLLFPYDKANDIKRKLIELEDLKSINTSYQKSIDLYKNNQDLYSKQVTILLDQNKKLLDSEQAISQLSTYEKIGYFALGVLATGSSFYVASQILNHK